MKLWGGRFTKETNQLVQNFNESLSFDRKFYRQDIRGSIAHVKMLGKQAENHLWSFQKAMNCGIMLDKRMMLRDLLRNCLKPSKRILPVSG